MNYVYIIKSLSKGALYIGSTDDIKNRLDRHNGGNVVSTKSRRPWVLIYYEAFISQKDARREELFLKSGKGRERIKYLFSTDEQSTL